MRSRTLEELALLTGAKLQGDPQCIVSGIAPLERAIEGDLSFLSHPRYRKFLTTTKASAVIVGMDAAQDCPVHALISENPRLTLAKIAKLFEKPMESLPGIHATAIIGAECDIHTSVSIGAHCVIGNGVTLKAGGIVGPGSVIGDNCEIGEDTTLMAKVTLYNKIRIGNRCLIHSGAVIGSDGFGYASDEGTWVKMPHLGGVLIGDQVEIGANTTIDKGFLEDTVLEDGVIIDNLVQIGHNVSIGARTAIAACVGIAGSAKIGSGCLIGGCATIAGHLEIGDNVYITATSGVNSSILEPGVYSSGMPAKPNAIWRKNIARFSYLDDMAKRIRALEKKVNAKLALAEEQ